MLLGFLREKTRILVTHQLHVLPQADKIIFLQDGKVAFFGTYQELLQSDLDIQEALRDKNEISSPRKKPLREIEF